MKNLEAARRELLSGKKSDALFDERPSGIDGSLPGGLVRANAMGSAITDPLQVLRTQFTQSRQWVDTGCILQVVVKQAYNIGTMGLSPDPYVRIYMGPNDTSDCEIKGSTRVVYRNRNPIWEEGFLFSLRNQALDENSYLTLHVISYDQLKDTFLGQFQWRLSMLLGTVKAVGVPMHERYPLHDRNNEDLMAGELELCLTVLPPTINPEVIPAGKELYSSSTLQRRFGSRSLQLNLRCIQGLRTANSVDDVQRMIKDLKVEIRVGTLLVKTPNTMQTQMTQSLRTGQTTATIVLDHKLVIPLVDAFTIHAPVLGRGLTALPLSHMRRKAAQELGDVRIYLNSMTAGTVCKAQFPLWKLLTDVTSSGSPSKQQGSPGLDSAPRLDAPRPPAAVSVDLDGSGRTRVRRNSTQGFLGIRTSRMSVGGIGNEPEPFLEAAPEQDFILPMERYGKALLHPVEIDFTAQVIETPSQVPAEATDAAIQQVEDDDEEDVLSAPPLDASLIPAPLPVEICKEEFQAGPCRLYSLLTNPNSTLMKNIWEKENCSNVKVPDFVDNDDASKRTRQVSYLVAKSSGGWVLEVAIRTTAPKGDLFVVRWQVVAQKSSNATTPSSSLRVTMLVDWVKPAGMLKGIIEGASIKDSKSHWINVSQAVHQFGAAQPLARTPSATSKLTSAGSGAPSAGATAMVAVSKESRLQWLKDPLESVLGGDAVPSLFISCCCLLLLVLVLWWQAAGLRRQVQQLSLGQQAQVQDQATIAAAASAQNVGSSLTRSALEVCGIALQVCKKACIGGAIAAGGVAGTAAGAARGEL